MPAFKPKPRKWSVTPFGWVLLAILAAALVVAALGPGSVQVVGLVVVALVGFVLVGGGMSGGSARRRTGKTLAQRRAEFGPRRRLSAAAETLNAEDVWLREREQREQREQPAEPGAARGAEMPDVGL